MEGELGLRGNFSADPLFCDAAAGDFTLSSQSPCLPGNHPDGADCGLIGAFGQGCGTVSVQPSSWGAIKEMYRVRRALRAAIALLGAGALHGSFARGATLHVPGEYPTIQAGIDAASPGDSVLVGPGTWTDRDTRQINPFDPSVLITSCGFLKAPLAVIGTEGAEATIVDGGDLGPATVITTRARSTSRTCASSPSAARTPRPTGRRTARSSSSSRTRPPDACDQIFRHARPTAPGSRSWSRPARAARPARTSSRAASASSTPRPTPRGRRARRRPTTRRATSGPLYADLRHLHAPSADGIGPARA